MEQLIRKVADNYSALLDKKALFEHHLEARENADMRDALTLVNIQIGAIESWFTLMDLEERVVFRQYLLGDYCADAANRIAATKWTQQAISAGESPWLMREAAFEKVTRFADAHRKLILALFENV